MKVVTAILAALMFILVCCTPSEPCEEAKSPVENTTEMSIE